MNQPLISVIVPVYNVGEFLAPCLDSLLAQTYQNLEILLIDDGSTDGSGARCDEYAAKDPRFKVIHKENGGVSSARNLGLDIAKGQYIAFVDSDDRVKPDYFEVLLRDAVEQNADIVYCNAMDVDEHGNLLMEVDSIKQKARMENLESILHKFACREGRHYSVVWASIMKADRIKTIRFERLPFGEDTYFMFAVLFTRPVVYEDDYAGYYYVRRASGVTMRFSNTDIRRRLAYLQVFRYIYRNLPPLPAADEDFYLARYAREVYLIANISSGLKDVKERQYYRELLEEHLRLILPLKARLHRRTGIFLTAYVKYPQLHACLVRIQDALKKLIGR